MQIQPPGAEQITGGLRMQCAPFLERPLLAGKRPPLRGGRVRTAMLEKQTTALAIQCSHLGLFRDLQRVVDLYAEISYCAFELRVPKKQLNRPEILRASVDQRRFCPAHRMCPIRIRIKTNFCDPVIDDSRVLPGAKMR